MREARRLWRWLAARPFTASLVVMLCAAIPGYVRQERTIDEAHRATERLEEVVADREADRAERRHELCLRDVEDRRDVRAYWDWLFDNLLDNSSPRVQQARAQLDVIHPLLKCNAEDIPVPVD